MSARERGTDLRVTGLGLRGRFVLSMTVALSLVMVLTALTIFASVAAITDTRMTDAFSGAVRFSRETPLYERLPGGVRHPTGVTIEDIVYGDGRTGSLYTFGSEDDPLGVEKLFVPDTDDGRGELLSLLFAIMAIVVLVGAGVALWVAGQVARPVHVLVDDVRQIAKGNLDRRTRARGAGEIELLARSIDRMTADLKEAQQAELELEIRQREREVAGGVREALLPLATPLVDGYDVGAAFLTGPDFGGDFHHFLERPDGKLGLLVCDVSGNGIPAALVGATARAYLRSELEHTDDLLAAFQRVNRWLYSDMRRGMYVTALYALLDPRAGSATILCAGHRVPLLRYDAAEDQIRVVHPEGIALAFDKGPVFDHRVQIVETPIEPGDRFVLCNSGPVALTNPEGRELGEKPFYARVLKHAAQPTPQFLKSLRRDLEGFAGEGGLDRDVSLVTIRREA